MCFYISKEFPSVLTAEEDIECYKIIEKEKDQYVSIYQSFIYVLGKTYILKKSFKQTNKYSKEISNGFHSYVTLALAKAKARSHSIYSRKSVFIKCLIPKGALYWQNLADEEYVSNQIQIISEI